MNPDFIKQLERQHLSPEGERQYRRLATTMSPEHAIAHMRHVLSQNQQLLFQMVKPEALSPYMPHAQTIGMTAPCAPQSLENKLGDYTILAELGAGGMGKVYLVEQPQLRQRFAAKVSLAHGAEDIIRFEREARNQAKLDHPNILKVHHVGIHTIRAGATEKNTPYFVMEFAQGGDLHRYIQTQLPGRADRADVSAAIAKDIAAGLAHAHSKGVIHRDLKPANILLTNEGKVKIMDFGLAKDLTSQSLKLTQEGALLGTPAYMAPEQAIGNTSQVDGQTDVYAAGAILYEMLTGQRPYLSMNSMQLLSDITDLTISPPLLRTFDKTIPRDLETICMKAMQKDKAKRYQCAKDFEDDLDNYLNGEPISARPETLTEKSVRALRRHPILATSAAGIVLITGILGTTFAARSYNGMKRVESLTAQASQAEQTRDYSKARTLAEQILAFDPSNRFALERRAEYASLERTSILEQEARNELIAAIESGNFEHAGRSLEVVRRLNPDAADIAALESRIVGYAPVTISTPAPFTLKNILTGEVVANENESATVQLPPGHYLIDSEPQGFARYRNIIHVEREQAVTLQIASVPALEGFVFMPGGRSMQGVGADEQETIVSPFYLQERHITLADYLSFYRAATPSQRDALKPTIFHQTRDPTPIDPETLEADGIALNRAMVLLTPQQMRDYANWYSREHIAGARVATEAELRLAYGEQSGQLYLTGNSFDRTRLRIRTPEQRREAFAQEFPDESAALRNPFGIAILELSDFCLTADDRNIAVGPALKFHRNVGDYLCAVRQTPTITGNSYTGLRLARSLD